MGTGVVILDESGEEQYRPPRFFGSDELLEIRDIANRLAEWLTLPTMRSRGEVLLISTWLIDGVVDRRQVLQRLIEVLRREAKGKPNSLEAGRLVRAVGIEAATIGQSLSNVFDCDLPRELIDLPGHRRLLEKSSRGALKSGGGFPEKV